MLLLELPFEVLNLVVGKLDLQAFLKLCASCRHFRNIFTIGSLSFLATNSIKQRRSAIEQLHYISRSQLLAHCFSHMRVSELQILIETKASFRYVSCGHLVEDTFLDFGPGPRLDFLVQHGASLWDVPRGINKLLEDTFRDVGGSRRVDYLIQHGASLKAVPGIHKLLEESFRSFGRGRDVAYLIRHGFSLKDVPCGINKLLEDKFRRFGCGRDVDFLIQHGASLKDVPCGINKLLEDSFCRFGHTRDADFLIQHGACRTSQWCKCLAFSYFNTDV